MIGKLTVTDPCELQDGWIPVTKGAVGEVGATFMVTTFDAPEVLHALVAVTV